MSSGKPRRRQRRFPLLTMLLTVLILGIAALLLLSPFQLAHSLLPQAPSPLANPQTLAAAQMLPITAQTRIGETTLDLEVAHTPQEQALGLMFRSSLPPHQGMLFPFNPPRPVSFWMKNCLIPLDMIFLRQGKVVAIALNAPPCPSPPCPFYDSGQPVDQVIEVRGGLTQELGLQVGDQLQVDFLPQSNQMSSQL